MRKILIFGVATIIASSTPAFARMRRQLALMGIIKMPMAYAFTNRRRSRMKVQPLFVGMVSIPMRHAGRIFAPIMAALPSY
jgi:hypothetical protein